ncbi:MAG: thymidylate synthase (FAD) [Flavobacteriales bacterium]|nr:thymidylate synthase (FAD) [Flavobacteriales bacterium]|tara:strand:+ start:7568 stop:8326 length:759 start_codon:yes stop_codon:yes gene_type:complete
MKVELVDYMGSDLSVANAARVSFNKKTKAKSSETKNVSFYGSGETSVEIPKLKERDEKLIRYLARHNHWTPFAHTCITFHIKAPMFVARQLQKHQIGLVWNEVSRRYIKEEPEFYIPEEWRYQAENVKQGSSDDSIKDDDLDYKIKMEYNDDKDWTDDLVLTPSEISEDSKLTYNALLDIGICPEQARMVLPQNTYTEWYWTGSLFAFARVCKLRCARDTQKETRDIANEILSLCSEIYPVSWKYLTEKKEK